MLTEIAIRNLKPGPVRYEKPDGKGLFVVVQPTGKKSYAVRFRVHGKPKKLTLPKGLSLAEARAEAAAAILKVYRGGDPTVTKRKAKEAQQAAAANTFKAICEFIPRTGREEEGWRAAAQPGMAAHAVAASCLPDARRPADQLPSGARPSSICWTPSRIATGRRWRTQRSPSCARSCAGTPCATRTMSCRSCRAWRGSNPTIMLAHGSCLMTSCALSGKRPRNVPTRSRR